MTLPPATPAPPVTEDVAWFRIEEPSAVGAARRAAMQLAERLGIGPGRTGEVGIAVTEACTNLVKHATDGSLLLRAVRYEAGGMVEFLVVDRGPGMPNVSAVVQDGHSSTGTLGIGLGAIDRLADAWDVYSAPAGGTVLVAALGERRAGAGPVAPPASPVEGLTRPMTGESVCGDGYAVRQAGGRLQVLLCDGLGHGPLAARATGEALRIFGACADSGPVDLLKAVHGGLSHTRGVAAALADIDFAAGRVRFAGIGNISAAVVGERRRGMISSPGIVGHQLGRVQEYMYDLPVGSLVVLHSDGLQERWDFSAYPGLARHRPLTVAATLLRDAGLRRDDASIVVAKAS
jgi:anti-sigma regulatory factor (Ser/Thr protein kinase)